MATKIQYSNRVMLLSENLKNSTQRENRICAAKCFWDKIKAIYKQKGRADQEMKSCTFSLSAFEVFDAANVKSLCNEVDLARNLNAGRNFTHEAGSAIIVDYIVVEASLL